MSRRVKVGIGQVVRLFGRAVQIVAFDHDVERRPLALYKIGDHVDSIAFAELLREVAASLPAIKPEEQLMRADAPEFLSLSSEQQARVLAEARDLTQVLTGSTRGDADRDRAEGRLDPRYDPLTTSMRERVHTKVAELAARGISVHPSTIFRRVQRLESEGLVGLIHKGRRFGADGPQVSPEVEAAIAEILTDRKDQPQVSNTRLAVIVRAGLLERGLELDLSGSQLKQVVARLSRGLALHRQVRSRDNRYDPQEVYRGFRALRPGELIQIDDSVGNLFCWFSETGEVYRAHVLTAIDVFSHCIVAMRVLPHSPNSRDVAGLLFDLSNPVVRRAGWPYSHQLIHGVPRYVAINTDPNGYDIQPPEIVGDKPAVYPSTIVMDNGKENLSIHVQSAAARAGIGLIYVPPASGHAKGHIESFHRTLDQVQAGLPGYLGNQPRNHPKNRADRDAVLTWADLQDILWEHILTVYHHTPQDGLFNPDEPTIPQSPAQVFERYLQDGGTIELPTDPLRLLEFLSVGQRLVQDYGINVGRRIYNSADLIALKPLVQSGAGTPGRPVTVYWDRYDVSRIFVRHPTTGQVLCVPRIDPARLGMPPWSEVLTHVAIANELEEGHTRLSPTEVQLAEARLLAKWAQGVFRSRKEGRAASVNAANAARYAYDLEGASEEFKDLAFGSRTEPMEEPVDYGPDDDEEVLGYDENDDGFDPEQWL